MGTSKAVAAFALAAVAIAYFGIALGTDASAPPTALYTDEQAQKGLDPYEKLCAMCHGANMEGASGPTLLGPTFTSHYVTVGDLMQFIVQNMPNDNPGGLAHDDYVDILAYILLKNGWSSGTDPLTFDGASASKAPLTQAQ
ncbi:MAG: c-type cytochrome [Steroidobacteraceae bacterium]